MRSSRLKDVRRAYSLFALVALALSASPTRAQDAPLPVTLTWTGPDNCADGEIVRATVREIFGGAVPAAAPFRATAQVRERRGQLRLELVLERDGQRSRRVLSASTCDGLVSAAALILAIAIDPSCGLRGPQDEPGEAAAEPLAVSEPVTRPIQAVEPEESPHRIQPPNVSSRTPVAIHYFLRVAAELTLNMLPAPAMGASIAGGVAYGRTRVSLGLAFSAPRTAASGELSADISSIAARLLGCYELGRGVLVIEPCLGVEMGDVIASSVSAQIANVGHGLVLAASASIAAHIRVTRRVVAFLGADFVLPVVRPGFTIDSTEFFRVAQYGARAFAGFELHFN